MKTLKAQLKQVRNLETRISPNREWVLRNREKLMTQISHTSQQAATSTPSSVTRSVGMWAKIFVPHSFVHSLKPALSVIAALTITTFGWIASAYAQPGDMFWGAKNAVGSVLETGRLAFAGEDEQTTLKLNYASKQAHLLKQVIETDNVTAEKKEQLVEKTVEAFQKKFDSAQESLKTLPPESVAGLVKEVSLSTRDISQTLQEATVVAEKTNVNLLEKIEKTASDAAAQSLEMVGDAVAKKTEANMEISAEEKVIVKEHIDTAVETIVSTALKAQDKLQTQSGTTSTTITTTVSTDVVTTTSSSSDSTTTTREISAVIDEQKKTVETLKETNLLEAINITKSLAAQVSSAISQVNSGTHVSTSTPLSIITTTTSSTPIITSSTSTTIPVVSTTSSTVPKTSSTVSQ